MKHRAWLLLLGCLILDPGCESGGLVGGDCTSGLTECDQRCLDLGSDDQNCGACGRVCPIGVACVHGSCGEVLDAGEDATGGAPSDAEPDRPQSDAEPPDGGPDASDAESDATEDTGSDASEDTGSDGGEDTGADVSEDTGSDTSNDTEGPDAESDAQPGDATTDTGPDGEEPCVPPYKTPQQCGSCTISCPPELPVCQWMVENWSCVSGCASNLDNCSGTCADLSSDPDHCGWCGHACLSRICEQGQCQGAPAGNVVAFCMDYQQSARNLTATVMLGNAVFLAAHRPVRVLAYDRYADPAVTQQVNNTISWTAPSADSYSITVVSADDQVLARLNVLDYDVLLIYDQTSSLAPAGSLGLLGSTWSDLLLRFAQGGGTVIVLDGGGGGEMWDFITRAGLFEVSGELDLTGTQLYVRAQTDALARRDRGDIVSPFRALNRTCAFQTSLVPDFENVFVVTDSASGDLGHPVIVHRAVLPPPSTP